MKRRKIFVILGVLVLAGAIFLATQLSSGSPNGSQPGKSTQSSQQVTAAIVVDAMKAEMKPIQTFVNLTGRLIPEDKIEIYAEVTGVLQNRGKSFKTGIYYRRGQVLVNIDSEEARQNLVAQKSSFMNALAKVVPDLKIDYPDIYPEWRQYLLEVDLQDRLPALPEVETEQQKLFLTGRNIYTQFYNIRQLETRLDKYQIRAPFSGVVTEAAINEGTLVRAGQKIGEFAQTGIFELEAAVGIDELPFVNTGDKVKLSPTKTDQQFTGTVSRINARVEQETQTVKVYIRLQNPGLKAGMYLEGKIEAETYQDALEVPKEILVDENKIFVVKDSTARLTPVEVLDATIEEAIIAGVEEGAILIQESKNAAFEGSKVNPVLKSSS